MISMQFFFGFTDTCKTSYLTPFLLNILSSLFFFCCFCVLHSKRLFKFEVVFWYKFDKGMLGILLVCIISGGVFESINIAGVRVVRWLKLRILELIFLFSFLFLFDEITSKPILKLSIHLNS